ncbi:MAG: IS5 family transposase, partial [Paracoccaceae bacterium]
GSRVGDAPMLPDLLGQIPEDQPIHRGTADGAYDTRTCHAAIAARGADAVIPPRKNGKPGKEQTAGATVRNHALRSCRRLGRAIWKRWTGYHRRSLVEAKMRCFKLLGERVMSHDFERQVAELQIRAAILNRFTALGTPLTQRAG